MPCRSDHMEPTTREKEFSVVLTFLEELKTGELNKDYLNGYNPPAYTQNPTQEQLNEATAQLCQEISEYTVTDFSLELQMWWRDHQEGEERRAKEDAEEKPKRPSRIVSCNSSKNRLMKST